MVRTFGAVNQITQVATLLLTKVDQHSADIAS